MAIRNWKTIIAILRDGTRTILLTRVPASFDTQKWAQKRRGIFYAFQVVRIHEEYWGDV